MGLDAPTVPDFQSDIYAQDAPTVESANNFEVDASHAPGPKNGNEAQWLIDGEDAMESIAKSIESAQKSVWLADWHLSPHVRLRRGKTELRLIDLLADVAQRVQVRVLLYRSVAAALNLYDDWAESILEGVNNKNIRVITHRPSIKNSHHQKIVIVDETEAHIGGIDLAYGRWDTRDHKLEPMTQPYSIVPDEKRNTKEVGIYDNYNANVPNAADPKNYVNTVRMPWHDVHVRIKGPAVEDIVNNFVERWNRYSPSATASPGGKFRAATYEKVIEKSKTSYSSSGNHQVQIVRSISSAAGGSRTEKGPNEAYVRMIKSAQHYIYIENQFFISDCPANKKFVHNEIASVVAQRISRAIWDEHQTGSQVPFRVILMLPAHPEGPLEDASTAFRILALQLNTLRFLRDQIGIAIGLRNAFVRTAKAIDGTSTISLNRSVNDYLSVYCLRNWKTIPYHKTGESGASGTIDVTEQIYVHSKMMIVDDNVTFIGSANVNDRSLLGDRDSEIGAVINDAAYMRAPLGGEERNVRQFARSLRKALWKEHFGEDFEDPSVDSTYARMREIALLNTAKLEKFPDVPRDSYKTFNEYLGVLKKERTLMQSGSRTVAGVGGLQGHATLFPLDWLASDPLQDGLYEGGIDTDTYTDLDDESPIVLPT